MKTAIETKRNAVINEFFDGTNMEEAFDTLGLMLSEYVSNEQAGSIELANATYFTNRLLLLLSNLDRLKNEDNNNRPDKAYQPQSLIKGRKINNLI